MYTWTKITSTSRESSKIDGDRYLVELVSLLRPFSMMPDVRNCEKCSLHIDIDKEPFTVCEGICAKSFHAECVGLSVTDLSVLSGNILWLCNGCLTAFCRYREKSSTDAATNTSATRSIEDEITELKNTVAGIADTLARVTQKIAPIVPHCSTPVSSLKPLDGTGEILGEASENERTQASSHEESRDFSLYLTHIDKCATENDISQMVSRSLGAPLSSCNEVVKLVPKWKDINTLDYISFKVVLDRKWEPTAMTASTWPKGVKFREFVNQLNETWRPLK